MQKTKLRIGISSCFFHADPKRAIFKGKTLLYLEQSIAHWVMSSGSIAYMIPTIPSNLSLQDFVTDLDGLVLQGGSDVSPLSYKETPMQPEWSGDFIRDQYEIELVNEFVKQQKPVLGICRGLQLLNVAFGGTLYQDISTQIQGAIEHRNWEIYDQNFHTIKIEKKSHLEKLYKNCETFKVNSVHHQAIKKLGNNLKIEAISTEDQLIEAIRYTGNSYVYAVQWHPEFIDSQDKTLMDTKPLLNDFIFEVQKRKNLKN